MDRCWLQGSTGDALHAISCAAGYNIRWLLRAIARLGIAAVFLRLLRAAFITQSAKAGPYDPHGPPMDRTSWPLARQGDADQSANLASPQVCWVSGNEFCRAD